MLFQNGKFQFQRLFKKPGKVFSGNFSNFVHGFSFEFFKCCYSKLSNFLNPLFFLEISTRIGTYSLHRYCAESTYRFNSRKIKDKQRFTIFFSNPAGRITYKNLIKKD